MTASTPQEQRATENTRTGDTATAGKTLGTNPAGRTASVERPVRRVAVVAGMLLMPLAAIVPASAALLRAGDWTGAVLVLAGALLLAAGIGLVSTPAHTEHVALHSPRAGRPETPAGAGKHARH